MTFICLLLLEETHSSLLEAQGSFFQWREYWVRKIHYYREMLPTFAVGLRMICHTLVAFMLIRLLAGSLHMDPLRAKINGNRREKLLLL